MTRRSCVRRRWSRVLIGALAILACVAASAETLTIATYNVENYGLANRITEVGFRSDYPKPETQKRALRQAIVAINADVLVLQEMGTAPYLEELRRDLRADGADYPHAALAVAADPDRHVAVLSRRPLTNVMTLANLDFAYLGGRERVKRGVLMATVSTAAGDLTIFAVHLKSRLTERPDDPLSAIRRAAEATAVRDAVLRRFPNPDGARFIILGDCNDTKASKALEHLQHRGATTIATLLPASDSHGETWTYSYRREDTYTRVDHILVSPPLHARIADGKARIYDGPGVKEASDHRPVFVRLELSAR